MRPILISVTLLLVAGTAGAQQASYGYFGQGCPTGEPHFSVVGVPRIGGSFVVLAPDSCRGGCVDGGTESWVLTGFSDTQFGGIPLPFDLRNLDPRMCGPLLTSVEVMHWTPRNLGPSGFAEVVFRVPNDSALSGVSFYQQVFTYYWSWWGGFREWWYTSRGGHGVIGS